MIIKVWSKVKNLKKCNITREIKNGEKEQNSNFRLLFKKEIEEKRENDIF